MNETIVRDAAKAMVDSGLKDLGYEYVNIDDCWATMEGTGRDTDGRVIVNNNTFPSGMKALGDYIHSLGLKFGIYSDAGTHTCAYQPGSLGYEEIDAQTYAEWGVDYLKYDNCNNQGLPSKPRYTKMRDALNKTGRPIFFSMCSWGVEDVATWGNEVGNSWRTWNDIWDSFAAVKINLFHNAEHPETASPGAWNDPDMLEVGNGGMSVAEYETHFSLWALIKAPLLIGCDMTNMNADTKRILSNKAVIAINQDPLGKQGTCRLNCDEDSADTKPSIWAIELVNGDAAVVVANLGDNMQKDIRFSLRDVGLSTTKYYQVKDLWTGDKQKAQGYLFVGRLESHQSKTYRFHDMEAYNL